MGFDQVLWFKKIFFFLFARFLVTTSLGNASDCDIDDLLAQCYHWNFPIFELRDATNEVLSKLAYRLFDLSGLFTHFRLPRDKFLSYFRHVGNLPYPRRTPARI